MMDTVVTFCTSTGIKTVVSQHVKPLMIENQGTLYPIGNLSVLVALAERLRSQEDEQ